MRVTLSFNTKDEPEVTLVGETDIERTLLGFLAEGPERRWVVAPSYTYRPGAVTNLKLQRERPNPQR